MRRVNKVDGTFEFVHSGDKNIYDFIQSSNVGLTPTELVNMYGVDLFQTPQLKDEHFSPEFSKPIDLLDAHAKIIELRESFDKSDIQFREKFGFEFTRFLKSFSSKSSYSHNDFVNEFFEVNEIVDPVVVDKPVKEVK